MRKGLGSGKGEGEVRAEDDGRGSATIGGTELGHVWQGHET